MEVDKIVIFKGKNIRRILHNDEWWFSIIDIVELLTESSKPRRYWDDLKSKLSKDEGFRTWRKRMATKNGIRAQKP